MQRICEIAVAIRDGFIALPRRTKGLKELLSERSQLTVAVVAQIVPVDREPAIFLEVHALSRFPSYEDLLFWLQEKLEHVP